MPGHRFRRGWAFERHTPEWGRHGRAAGPIRNRGMVTGCGLAVFFWDGQSPGTADAIATAGPRWKSSTPRVRRPGMDRPTIELADVVRGCGAALADRYPLTPGQRRALGDVARCRTAELGGHVEGCVGCGHRRVAYNSCRNRHCPKCLAGEQGVWQILLASLSRFGQ